MSRSLSRWQAVLLGVVVLAGGGLGGLGLFVVGSRTWPGRDDLHVLVGFPEIKGVEVGTRVRIQGIDAGEVSRITPPQTPDGQVVLRLRVRGEYRHLVRVSSVVQIVSEGMLGGKVVEIRPNVKKSGQPASDSRPAYEDDLLTSEPTVELGDVLSQVGDAFKGVQNGQGTLGRLVKDPQAYEAMLALLKSGSEAAERSKDTMTAIQRDAEALKKVPILGGYIEDPVTILVRSSSQRHRRVLADSALFEPGRAVLTSAGREKLDELAPWLGELKPKGSEVVVVSYASPKGADAKAALSVTRQQSETVANYLKANHRIHKLGWFSSRNVIALGMGTQPPPIAERETLPPARTEVIVFVPES